MRVEFKNGGDWIKQLEKRNNLDPSSKLRHTFAVSYLGNGDDVFIMQYLLRHAALQNNPGQAKYVYFFNISLTPLNRSRRPLL